MLMHNLSRTQNHCFYSNHGQSLPFLSVWTCSRPECDLVREPCRSMDMGWGAAHVCVEILHECRSTEGL